MDANKTIYSKEERLFFILEIMIPACAELKEGNKIINKETKEPKNERKKGGLISSTSSFCIICFCFLKQEINKKGLANKPKIQTNKGSFKK